MPPDTFQSKYCQRHDVAPEAFAAHVLARTLYPHARAASTVLGWLNGQHHQADHEFIEDIGHIRSARGFSDAAQAYVDHFSNHGFLRGRLRLRISVRRMWRLVSEIFLEESSDRIGRNLDSPHSFTPFGKDEDGG